MNVQQIMEDVILIRIAQIPKEAFHVLVIMDILEMDSIVMVTIFLFHFESIKKIIKKLFTVQVNK